MAPPENHHTLEQTPIAAAWRYRWLVLAMAVIGGAAALLIATATQTTRYSATASLVVTDPRATTLFGAAEITRLDQERYVADQVAILESDSVIQRAADLVVAGDAEIEIDSIDIASGASIFTSDSNQILVRYQADDEPTAVAAVNAVIDAYSEVRKSEAQRQSASAIEQLDQSIQDLDRELEEIERQINEVRDYPERLVLDLQFDEALATLAELQALRSTASEAELPDLRAEIRDISDQLDTHARIIGIEDGSPRLVQLDREQAQAVSRQARLAIERDRLLVDTELLSGGISLSSPAQFARPTEPRLAATTAAGAIAGLLVGGAASYLLSLRRRKFDERAQPGWVLNTPLLAEVPVFGDEGIKSELPVMEHPASASAEAFRFAATALDLSAPRVLDPDGARAPRPHTYLVTSAGPQEGKTVLTANLALAAARKGRSVLAVDADFGHQRLSQLLRGEHTGGAGMTEIVETGLDLVSGTFSLGPPGPLDLMSRGRRPTNAPDFFSLPATQAFFAKVSRLYDIVLIDGPPMLHVAYASILAQYVDSVVVVARHGGSVTRLEDLAQRLDLVGTPLSGYVYNGAALRYEMTLTEGSLQDVLGEGVEK